MTAKQTEARLLYRELGSYAAVGRVLGISRGAVWVRCNPTAMAHHKRAYLADPAKAERHRETSRRWKRQHLGQPGRPAGKSS